MILLGLCVSLRPLHAQSDRIAADQICTSTDSIFIAPCRQFRARLTGGADNIAVRIWPVGTRRVLGYAGAALRCKLPENIESLMERETTIFADVTIRPVSRDIPGHMQFVCIASATHVRVQDGH